MILYIPCLRTCTGDLGTLRTHLESGAGASAGSVLGEGGEHVALELV